MITPKTPQTDDDFIHAAWFMPRFGGFADAIAKAYFVADKDNKRKLRDAFKTLFVGGFLLYEEEMARQKETASV